MSQEKPKEFRKECIGYVDSEIFPNICSHFCLDGLCKFFIDSNTGKQILCDDLQERTINK